MKANRGCCLVRSELRWLVFALTLSTLAWGQDSKKSTSSAPPPARTSQQPGQTYHPQPTHGTTNQGTRPTTGTVSHTPSSSASSPNTHPYSRGGANPSLAKPNTPGAKPGT